MKGEIVKKDCNKLVVKHNKLIEFKGRMTTNELKLFSLIIADVREQQQRQFEEYQIDISVLQETTKHNDFYNYIKEVALKLENKRIVVDGLTEKNKKYFTTIRLINKPRFVEGSNRLTIDIDKDLIPYIIDLKREFTRYEIENILRLNSNYSIRIYELVKQYENIGLREIKIQDLRHYLGIEDSEYKRFYDFEKRVLEVAKEGINEHTDIIIDYEKVKTGRRITSIIFKVEPKDQVDKVYIEYLNKFYNIQEIKLKMGIGEENFNSKQIMDIYEIAVNKIEGEEIDIFEYVRLNYLHIKNKARNKYSYLLKALENDYAVAISQISLDYYIENKDS